MRTRARDARRRSSSLEGGASARMPSPPNAYSRENARTGLLYRRPADAVEAVAPGDDVAVEAVPLALVVVGDERRPRTRSRGRRRLPPRTGAAARRRGALRSDPSPPAVRGGAASPAAERPDRRPPHRDLRPDGGGEGSDRSAPRRLRCRSCSRWETSTSTTSSRARPASPSRTEGGGHPSNAISSRAAMASTASAGRRSRPVVLRVFARVYAFAWLGILAEVAPLE